MKDMSKVKNIPLKKLENDKLPLQRKCLDVREYIDRHQNTLFYLGSGFIEYNNVHRFFDDETFIIDNAKLTAQGVLGELIQSIECELSHITIDLLGFGYTGKEIYTLLKPLVQDIRIVKGKTHDYPCEGVELEKYLKVNNFRKMIINTIPKIIFDDTNYEKLIGCTILDIASGEGCILNSQCIDENVNVKHLYSLPDKYTPLDGAKRIICKLRKDQII